MLVIEDDEKELAATVAAGLRHSRMAVDVAFDGRGRVDTRAVNDYDVIVLDRDLPGFTATRCAPGWSRPTDAAGC